MAEPGQKRGRTLGRCCSDLAPGTGRGRWCKEVNVGSVFEITSVFFLSFFVLLVPVLRYLTKLPLPVIQRDTSLLTSPSNPSIYPCIHQLYDQANDAVKELDALEKAAKAPPAGGEENGCGDGQQPPGKKAKTEKRTSLYAQQVNNN